MISLVEKRFEGLVMQENGRTTYTSRKGLLTEDTKQEMVFNNLM